MELSYLLSVDKDNAPKAAAGLKPEDIGCLAALLDKKDDKLRYAAFLLLQSRSRIADDVYPYFEVFADKLKSGNSYQRSIGLMLMAENARWDTLLKLDASLDEYLSCIGDEKPVTARQCIQALEHIVPHKTHLLGRITKALTEADIAAQKPTMKKLILADIINVLLQIRKLEPQNCIDAYIADALSGGILDDKTKKQIMKNRGGGDAAGV